jgi:hypothetical protein
MTMREWREMMVGITSNKRSVGLLHFPMMIAIIPCFHNYMKTPLPTSYMHLIIGFNMS